MIAFYLLTMGAHGGANPLYKALVNEQAHAGNRTTVMSAASMAAFPGFAVGGIVLGVIADAASVSLAMIVGAAALACIVPLYLPALRRDRRTPPVPSPDAPVTQGPVAGHDQQG